MKMKTVITATLLLFAATSVVYLVLSESRARVETPLDDKEASVPLATSASSEPSGGGDEVQHKVIAYYFHGTVRCTTCRAIEQHAYDAVETGFHGELQSGALEWRAINVEEPGNQHFVDDYELTTRSLVLAAMEGETRVRWQNLDRIWDLVSNPDAFIAYVQSETMAFLGEN